MSVQRKQDGWRPGTAQDLETMYHFKQRFRELKMLLDLVESGKLDMKAFFPDSGNANFRNGLQYSGSPTKPLYMAAWDADDSATGTQPNRRVRSIEAEDARALMGAAPAGYGLGTTTQKAPNDDPNEITKTGFYSAQHSNLAPGSSGRSHILHIECTSNYAIQFQYDLDTPLQAVRRKLAGVWQDWADCSPSAFAPAGHISEYTITSSAVSLDDLIKQQFSKTNAREMRYFMFNNTVSNDIPAAIWVGTIYKYSELDGKVELRHIYQGLKHEIHRFLNNGSWGEWEWINPPMGVGVEYRTTERWNGKPVYKKLIEYTNPAAISGAMTLNIPHGITNLDMMLSLKGTTNGYVLPYVTSGSSLSISGWNSTSVTMYVNTPSSWGAGRKWYIEMRYTKTL